MEVGRLGFAEPLKQALSGSGMKPRYLSAERLAGLEKSLKSAHISHEGSDTKREFNFASSWTSVRILRELKTPSFKIE